MGKLVMLQTIYTLGRYFLANRQYEYQATCYTPVEAEGDYLLDKGQVKLHYVVAVDGVNYNIPVTVCCLYDTDIPEARQNKQQYYFDSITDHTPDPLATWKDVTGIQIDNSAGADIDLRAYLALTEEHPSLKKTTE